MGNIEDIEKRYAHLLCEDEKTCTALFGIEVGEGWYDIVDDMLCLIDNHIKRENERTTDAEKIRIVITQIKEKYGTLRVYYFDGDEYIYGVVDAYTKMSVNTCEACGANKDVGTTRGWVSRYCACCIGKINDERRNKNQSPLDWKLNR